jgi:alkylhydroperoxidase family enzyme
VPRWRESTTFDERERRVMGYAEAMTATPPTVSDDMVSELVEDLGVQAVVELTMMVAVENQRSRFNSAMGLTSQGFSDRCEIPGDG